MKKPKHEPRLKIDMPFEDFMQRLSNVDKSELEEEIKKSKANKPS